MSGVGWHITVLIPARDEELLLARCLRSVQEARFCLPDDVTSDLIVVSDGSMDRTAEIAEEIVQKSGQVVLCDAGNVGTARAIAAREALRRYKGPPNACWLSNTDADCEVPANWLLEQLAIAKRGFAACAGVVDVDSFVEHGVGVQERFRFTYLIHADGTHTHVHGANLGVRADAYLQTGGWYDLATREDHDLWDRLRRDKYPCLSDARLQVITSGRRLGRAPLGFAGALAAHNGPALLVAPQLLEA